MEHQREKAETFGFIGKQLGDEATQIEGFFRKVSTGDIGAGGVDPALCERRVDGVEHCVEPVAKLVAPGYVERNPRLPDLVFGAYEPLAHGGGRDEKRRCD